VKNGQGVENPNTEIVTFRLSVAKRHALETVAIFDDVALAEEIREGIELLLISRRNDEQFLKRVRESFDRVRDLLKDVPDAKAVFAILGEPAPNTAAESTC
jgi:hypothetical protein